ISTAPAARSSARAAVVRTSTTAPVARTSTKVAVPVRGRSSAAQPPRQSTTVVIDPGHGGFDRGGIPRQRVPESMMNLDVALRLRSILQAAGYRVIMTRDTD